MPSPQCVRIWTCVNIHDHFIFLWNTAVFNFLLDIINFNQKSNSMIYRQLGINCQGIKNRSLFMFSNRDRTCFFSKFSLWSLGMKAGRHGDLLPLRRGFLLFYSVYSSLKSNLWNILHESWLYRSKHHYQTNTILHSDQYSAIDKRSLYLSCKDKGLYPEQLNFLRLFTPINRF